LDQAMLQYLRGIIFLGCLMLNSLAYSQYTVSEHLWSSADEILLVRVIEEKPELWRSITTCTSDVIVQIVNTYKSTRFASDVKNVIFARLYDCSKEPIASNASMLKKDKRYIIFLLSKEPSEVEIAEEGKKKIYSLSDLALGILEYNDQLEGFLKSKQRAKH